MTLFTYIMLVFMTLYVGPAYGEIGIGQSPSSNIETQENYSFNNQEVGETESGKIKIFVAKEHTMTAVVDKQDCSIMRQKNSQVAFGWKFGGLMWGFGPEISIGRSSGIAWKRDVQKMVAEYQELCSRFNTGRLSQEEYNKEKGELVDRGYQYAEKLRKQFQEKKNSLFREMDQGNFISLENSRFESGCCFSRSQFLPVSETVFKDQMQHAALPTGVDFIGNHPTYEMNLDQVNQRLDAMVHINNMRRACGDPCLRQRSGINWNMNILMQRRW